MLTICEDVFVKTACRDEAFFAMYVLPRFGLDSLFLASPDITVRLSVFIRPNILS